MDRYSLAINLDWRSVLVVARPSFHSGRVCWVDIYVVADTPLNKINSRIIAFYLNKIGPVARSEYHALSSVLSNS